MIGLVRRRRSSAAAAAISLACLTGCEAADPASDALRVIPVQTATAQPIGGSRSVIASGTAAYDREATLSFRIAGVIDMLSVNVGDRVNAGQSLGRLAGTDVAAQLAGRKVELERAQRTLARLESLSSTGAIAASEAQDQRDIVRQARAAVTAAGYDGQSAVLASPFHGIVLERVAQIGETVSAGGRVLRVADTRSAFLVRVPLAPIDADKVKPGATAHVSFGGKPPVAGQVVRLQPLVNSATGTRMAEVRVVSAAGQSGAVATVRIATVDRNERELAVSIPAEAYVPRPGGRAGVFTITNERRAVFHPARLIRFEDDAAIVSGLPPHILVITAGAGYLKNGDALLVDEGGRP